MHLGKVMASITDLARRFKATAPTIGCMARLQGQGAGNPLLTSPYNVLSAVRNAAGVYRVTIKQSTVYGVQVQSGVKSVSKLIAPVAATDLFDVQVTIVSSTVFDIKVYAIIQGAGTTITRAAYDIIAGDFLDFTILLPAGDGTLPEA